MLSGLHLTITKKCIHFVVLNSLTFSRDAGKRLVLVEPSPVGVIILNTVCVDSACCFVQRIRTVEIKNKIRQCSNVAVKLVISFFSFGFC